MSSMPIRNGLTPSRSRYRRHISISTASICTDEYGLAVFDLIRHKRYGDDAVLIAFDLIELDGEDLRRKSNRAAQAQRATHIQELS